MIGVAIGLALCAIVAFGSRAALSRWPDSWFVREFLTPALLRPTGPYSVPSRRDLKRRATLITSIGIALLPLSVLSFKLSERATPMSRLRLSLEAYFFIFFLLGLVLILFGLSSFIAAWRRKPLRVLGESNEMYLDLATFLEESTQVDVGVLDWPDFEAISYESSAAERVRARLSERFPRDRPPVTEEDKMVLRELAAELRRATA